MGNKPNGRHCDVCGAPLTGHQKRFCSEECAYQQKLADAVKNRRRCRICGKQIPKDRITWCSDACKYQDLDQRREKLGLESLQKICPVCGKKFRADNSKRVYCGVQCSGTSRVDHTGKPCRSRLCEQVRIRITKYLEGVYPELQPRVGHVYEAEKHTSKQFDFNKTTYIIRSIGPIGLIVRQNEAVEV